MTGHGVEESSVELRKELPKEFKGFQGDDKAPEHSRPLKIEFSISRDFKVSKDLYEPHFPQFHCTYKLRSYSEWFILHLKCCPLSRTALPFFFFFLMIGSILGKVEALAEFH